MVCVFLTWAIFKVFIEFVTILLLFYALVFGHKARGIFAPQPGIEPAPPVLEGEVLIIGLPGSPCLFVLSIVSFAVQKLLHLISTISLFLLLFLFPWEN